MLESRRWLVLAAVLWAVLAGGVRTDGAVSIQDLVRLEGYGASELWGIGLVTGLPGTGDGGEILPLARPLARLMERGANPIPDLAELADANAVALVMVTVSLPEEGVKKGDRLDAEVQALYGATSLEGGRLFITMLTGPLPGQGVYATASGPIAIDGAVATSGTVRQGARLLESIDKPVVSPSGTITLNILPRYAGWPTSDMIASSINKDAQGFFVEEFEIEPIAVALDERTVVVEIPEPDLGRPSEFISSMLTISFDESLLELPARVVINEEAGSIVLTGNVTISPSVVSHRDLVVTTITPEAPPTPLQPEIEQDTSEVISTADGDDPGLARAEDLLSALRALDVPVADQVVILKQLHRGGRLHGELIFQ